MCAFWWFVASREMAAAVRRKAEMLHATRRILATEPELADLATVLDVRVHQAHRAVAEHAAHEEAYRAYQNRYLMYLWMAPVVAVYAGLLLGAVTYNLTRTHYADDPHHLSFGHWGGMVLVFFSYVPEILFFLFVIEWLVPVGDYEIAQRVFGFRR